MKKGRSGALRDLPLHVLRRTLSQLSAIAQDRANDDLARLRALLMAAILDREQILYTTPQGVPPDAALTAANQALAPFGAAPDRAAA